MCSMSQLAGRREGAVVAALAGGASNLGLGESSSYNILFFLTGSGGRTYGSSANTGAVA